MNANSTLQASPQSEPTALGYLLATIKSVSGNNCEVEIGGTRISAALATHIPYVQAGQRVAVLDGGQQAPCLVIAAWPLEGSDDLPLRYDASNRTLHIKAARLEMSALAAIELSCGDARIRLSVDGKAQIEGKEIVSAAIGANKIEGATIDLN
jgi:hypothetical protein